MVQCVSKGLGCVRPLDVLVDKKTKLRGYKGEHMSNILYRSAQTTLLFGPNWSQSTNKKREKRTIGKWNDTCEPIRIGHVGA